MIWDGDAFLATIPKTQSMKAITDKLDFIKIKNVQSVKDNVKTMRRQATDWDKIFAKDISVKALLFKTYKELSKLKNNNKKWIKNEPKTLTDTSSKKTNRWQMKRYSTSYITREMQIKATMRYLSLEHGQYQMLVRIFGSKTSCSFTGGNVYTMVQSLWKKFGIFLKKQIYNLLTLQSSNHAAWYLPKAAKNISTQKVEYGCLQHFI